MKRIILWVMSTISALVMLFGYRTSLSSTSGTLNSASPKLVTPTTKAPTTASVTPSAVATTKTVPGSVIQTRWGPVQVQLTVTGKKITAVSVLQYPTGGRSDEINNQALPILVNETMTSQSASIDMVSGATYTSTGYVQSLQSALDQAGI